MTDEDLHRRGIETAVACWERFARSVRGAAVHRLRNVDVAVFPNGPERSIYNNAVLARSITAAECDVAVDVRQADDVVLLLTSGELGGLIKRIPQLVETKFPH